MPRKIPRLKKSEVAEILEQSRFKVGIINTPSHSGSGAHVYVPIAWMGKPLLIVPLDKGGQK